MIRVLAFSILAIILAGCSPSVPSAQLPDSSIAGSSLPVVVSAIDVMLREEMKKLEDIRRAYENHKDLGNYALVQVRR